MVSPRFLYPHVFSFSFFRTGPRSHSGTTILVYHSASAHPIHGVAQVVRAHTSLMLRLMLMLMPATSS